MKSVLVGYGRIANSIRHDQKISKVFKYASHSQVLNAHPGFEWVGVVDPDPVAQQTAAMDWGVDEIVPDAALLHEKYEFAVLAIPPEYRLETLRKFPIGTLKAVLIEKPLGAGGETFLNECEARGIRCYTNFWRRGVPDFEKLAKVRLPVLIGQPQTVFATYGNGLFNNGSHLVDFIRMLLGEPVGVPWTEARELSVTGCSGPLNDYHGSFVLDMGPYQIHVAALDFNKYREVSIDIWGTSGRYALFRESLQEYYYRTGEHHGMENQREIFQPTPSIRSPDVSMAFYNMYSKILDDSLPRSDMVTQDILECVANGHSYTPRPA